MLVAVVTTLGKSLNDDNRIDEDDPRDQNRPSSLDDDDHSRSEYYSHCATTAPLTDDSTKLPNTLDAFSLAYTIPKIANKDSENDIEGHNLDSEHVHDSDAIHKLLMDFHIDSDEDKVEGGISSGIPKKTIVALEVDDHKESLHFFTYNQQITVRFIKNRNTSEGFPH
jgi:hypothetical protein